MRKLLIPFFLLAFSGVAYAQSPADSLSKLTQPHNYVLKRVSSYDRTGGNDDYRPMAVGETLTLLDEPGPGEISHVWITIASGERYHLKKMVLRMYWDGEATRAWKHQWEIFSAWASATTFSINPFHSPLAATRPSIAFSRCPFRSTLASR